MFPVINIGPLALHTPGLVLLIGIWVGLLRTERFAKKLGIDSNKLYNLVLISMLAGLLAARFSYAAQNPSAFSGNIFGLFALTPNMLDPVGGIAAALLAALIYGRKHRMPFWTTLDALTPAAAVFAIVLGISHLASGNAYGMLTDTLPWRVFLWGASRHPSQIYEILAATVTAVLIWPRSDQAWAEIPGVRFLTFTGYSAAFRIFLEAFRGDSQLIFTTIRLPQLIAFIILALALWMLDRRFTKHTPYPTAESEGTS